MAVVAGVDFGTLNVRVSLVDSERGLLHSAIKEYPLRRKREDPEFATQSHTDHMHALAGATREALQKSGVKNDQVLAIALDTTGSSVIPVGKNLQPLDDYYLWCDIAPKPKPPKSPKPRTAKSSKPSNGAEACIPQNGVSPNCSTGCA